MYFNRRNLFSSNISNGVLHGFACFVAKSDLHALHAKRPSRILKQRNELN